jgi:hypothetical protein
MKKRVSLSILVCLVLLGILLGLYMLQNNNNWLTSFWNQKFKYDSKSIPNKFLEIVLVTNFFEFYDMAMIQSDKQLKINAIPNKSNWEESDIAKLLRYIGLDFEDRLSVQSIVKLSTQKSQDFTVIYQFPKKTFKKSKGYLNENNFIITPKEGFDIYTSKVELTNTGKMSYSFIADKLIIGDISTVNQIASILSGSNKGSVIYSQEYQKYIKPVYGYLPNGFSMVIAIGNEHSYISDLPAISWGESTRKLDQEYAEIVFVANFETSNEAASAKDKIIENIQSFGGFTGEIIPIKKASCYKNVIVIYFKTKLKDVIF